MSEENQTGQFQLNIQRIYVKDLSFEAPNAPQVFRGEWKPEMELNLGTQTSQVDNDTYEVVLKVTVTVKNGDKTAFLAEVHQAGVFVIKGVPQEQMAPLFQVVCPNILFPYAREAVGDLVNRGSFPQLILSPVNFEAIYAQQMQQQQQQAQAEPSEPAH